MNSIVLATAMLAAAGIISLGCGNDDDLEQYYRDAQRPYAVGGGITLTEFRTACEMLAVLDFQPIDEDTGKSRAAEHAKSNPRQWSEWMSNFNPSKADASLFGSNTAKEFRSAFVIMAIQFPKVEGITDDDPPDYWGNDSYFSDPSDANYPPRGFCKYVAGLEEPLVAEYSDASDSDDRLEEHYTNVQLGIQDVAAMSGIPIGGSASKREFAAACELLEAMNFRHSNTNNFVTLFEQEPEWTLARLDRIAPPSALIHQEGRSVAAALRAGAIMGAIEGDPQYQKSEQKALCEYIANR